MSPERDVRNLYVAEPKKKKTNKKQKINKNNKKTDHSGRKVEIAILCISI